MRILFILLTVAFLTGCAEDPELGKENLYGYWHVMGYQENGFDREEDTDIAYYFKSPDFGQRAYLGTRDDYTLIWLDDTHFEFVKCIPAVCLPIGLNNFEVQAQTKSRLQLRNWIYDEDGNKLSDQIYLMERISESDYDDY
ncbi:hypothetical protein [Fulvivirga sedimenti]|uniref:Lipocalin-like domain-containing protein n=1 Tax=Fulvivirga sedimenti TaxID=2879465 RepID=A0A9X1L1H0_9BACT|nr:hypothetical protein [Fulvivirga sedimenti]MCA6078829.1 hypothetical protein [Fulvivirga sedimenti]